VAPARTPAPDAGPDTALDAGLARLVAASGAPGAGATADVVLLLAAATAAIGGRDLRAATRRAAGALERSAGGGTPGLDGASGAAWALVEAARAVDDKALGWRALELAAAVAPGRSASARETAEVGLAHLRLWLAYRDPRSRSRVHDCLGDLLAGESVDADAGALVLAAGRVLGVGAALRAADATAAALRAAGDPPTPTAAAFLVRHHAATGCAPSRALAERAADDAADNAADDPATGHLLLDLATALAGTDLDAAARHRDRAARLATRLRRRTDVAALAWRLRLRHGGPRPWALDGPATRGLAAAC
jgi:hypothetical protein